MSHQTELQLLTLAGIAHRCAQETELFFQRQRYDPRYCFELFRRAIVHCNQRAWEIAYAQYRSLVAGWVERHSAFSTSGEEVQHFVNRAFEKMWVALTPDKFNNFSDLKSLLRYLQMCVHSVILDQVRVAEKSSVGIQDELLPKMFEVHPNYPNPFNAQTVIAYQIPKSSDVSIRIYSIVGRKICTLLHEHQSIGRYTSTWDGRDDLGVDVATGLYIAQIVMKADDGDVFNKRLKMTILK